MQTAFCWILSQLSITLKVGTHKSCCKYWPMKISLNTYINSCFAVGSDLTYSRKSIGNAYFQSKNYKGSGTIKEESIFIVFIQCFTVFHSIPHTELSI